jgi:hypothetical protein
VNYQATITNVGTTPLGDSPVWKARFTFIGPASAFSVTPVGSGITCSPSAPVMDCQGTSPGGDAMELAPGASVTFMVSALDLNPGPGLGGLLQVQVEADAPGPGAVAELNETNNTALVVTGTP